MRLSSNRSHDLTTVIDNIAMRHSLLSIVFIDYIGTKIIHKNATFKQIAFYPLTPIAKSSVQVSLHDRKAIYILEQNRDVDFVLVRKMQYVEFYYLYVMCCSIDLSWISLAALLV